MDTGNTGNTNNTKQLKCTVCQITGDAHYFYCVEMKSKRALCVPCLIQQGLDKLADVDIFGYNVLKQDAWDVMYDKQDLRKLFIAWSWSNLFKQ